MSGDAHGTREPAALAQRLRELRNRLDRGERMARMRGCFPSRIRQQEIEALTDALDVLERDAAARLAAPVEPRGDMVPASAAAVDQGRISRAQRWITGASSMGGLTGEALLVVREILRGADIKTAQATAAEQVKELPLKPTEADIAWARAVAAPATPLGETPPQETDAAAPLIAYMNATTTPARDVAYLRIYAGHIRNRFDLNFDIPNTRAATIEGIADRLEAGAASLPATRPTPQESDRVTRCTNRDELLAALVDQQRARNEAIADEWAASLPQGPTPQEKP